MKKDEPRLFTDYLTKRQLIELDACTGCGECLNWCPVYTAKEDKWYTPTSKIRTYRAILKNQHGIKAKLLSPNPIDEGLMTKFIDALYSCTTCGVCGAVCPVGVHCQELWPALRGQMVKLGRGPMGMQKMLPKIIGEVHNPYDMPHKKRFDWLPREVRVAERAEVAYFAGCTGSYTSQPMVEGAVRVLHALKVDFTMLDEWCCGFPLFVVGEHELLKELAEHNIDGLVAKGVRRLIISCPCCTNQIRTNWPKLYSGKLPFEIIHITQIVSEMADEGKLKLRKGLDEVVTYHDPCYLARGWGFGVGITDEPRKIIQQLPKTTFVEMDRKGRLAKCCGAGGGIRRAFADLSFDMAIAIVQDAEKAGAKILLDTCPACYERLHLALDMRKYKTEVKIMDLMQLTASLL